MKWTLSGKTLFLNCDSWSKTVHGFACMFGQMIVISLYNFLLFLFVRPVELFEMNIWRLPRCVIINFSSAYDGNQKSRTKNSKSWICMTFSVKKNKGHTFKGTSRAIELNFIFQPLFSPPLYVRVLPSYFALTSFVVLVLVPSVSFSFTYFLGISLSVTSTLCR